MRDDSFNILQIVKKMFDSWISKCSIFVHVKKEKKERKKKRNNWNASREIFDSWVKGCVHSNANRSDSYVFFLEFGECSEKIFVDFFYTSDF